MFAPPGGPRKLMTYHLTKMGKLKTLVRRMKTRRKKRVKRKVNTMTHLKPPTPKDEPARVVVQASGQLPQLTPEECDLLRRVIRSRCKRIRMREFKKFRLSKLRRQTGYRTLMALEVGRDSVAPPVVGDAWEAWWRHFGDNCKKEDYMSHDELMTFSECSIMVTSPDCGIQELEEYRESDNIPPDSTQTVGKFRKWLARRRRRFNRRNPLEQAFTINHLNHQSIRRRKKGYKTEQNPQARPRWSA